MALTAPQVEQAGSGKPKALGSGKHHDEHGLYLEVRNATSKSWTGRYTIAGEDQWRGIGPVKDISLKHARELHADNRRLVAEGIDPREHRRQLQAAAAVQARKSLPSSKWVSGPLPRMKLDGATPSTGSNGAIR